MAEPTVDPKTSDNPQNPNPGDQPNTDNLPEKFKGKKPEELVNSYLDLEKKSTQLGQELQMTKKQLADMKALEEFIDSDPESLAFLKSRLEIKRGKPNQQSDSKNTLPSDYENVKGEIADTRIATQGQIFEKFEGKFGIDRLKDQEKSAIQQKIGQELKSMLDPTGSRSVGEIIGRIPLSSLPMYLEKAYQLATIDDEKEQTRRKTLAQARRNADATFSSIPSSDLAEDSTTLSADEKKVAKGLGISEEKYLKQKKEIAQEYAQRQ